MLQSLSKTLRFGLQKVANFFFKIDRQGVELSCKYIIHKPRCFFMQPIWEQSSPNSAEKSLMDHKTDFPNHSYFNCPTCFSPRSNGHRFEIISILSHPTWFFSMISHNFANVTTYPLVACSQRSEDTISVNFFSRISLV